MHAHGVPQIPLAREVQENDRYTGAGPAQLIGDLRAEAARRGCDALVVGQEADRVSADLTTLLDHDDKVMLKAVRGTCIVFTAPNLTSGAALTAK